MASHLWQCNFCECSNTYPSSNCIMCGAKPDWKEPTPSLLQKPQLGNQNKSVNYGQQLSITNQHQPSKITWKCPTCQYKNKLTHHFCVYCGFDLSQEFNDELVFKNTNNNVKNNNKNIPNYSYNDKNQGNKKKNDGYFWYFVNDNNDINIVDESLSDQLNTTNVNDSYQNTFRYRFRGMVYNITKISDTKAVQINVQTNKKRDLIQMNDKKNQHNTKIKQNSNIEQKSDDDEFDEKDSIKQLFSKTMKDKYDIVKIRKLKDETSKEHLKTYNSLLSRIKRQWKKSGKNCNGIERLLFHGTKTSSTDLIIQNGFDRNFNETHKFGRGVYFARDASYSVSYCEDDTNKLYKNQLCMFVCRVIVGESIIGTESMKSSPMKQDGSNTQYETLVDDLINPSIFVVTRDYHSVPIYLITFVPKYNINNDNNYNSINNMLNIRNNNINTTMTKFNYFRHQPSMKPQIQVQCVCKGMLVKIHVNAAYNTTGKAHIVYCNECEELCFGFVFHCPRKNIMQHPPGYDLCGKCAKIGQTYNQRNNINANQNTSMFRSNVGWNNIGNISSFNSSNMRNNYNPKINHFNAFANGLSMKSQIQVRCICQAMLVKIHVTETYVRHNVILVYCDECGAQCVGFVFHCPRERIMQHPKGYDLCDQCVQFH